MAWQCGNRLPLAVLPILLGATLGLAGCEATPPDPLPNVVLVSIDTLRADATSLYGGPVATPTLDRLAREGVLFERAFAPAPETAPSHATLFTGQEVLRHGVTRNGFPIREETETLAERFLEAGYSTAAFVSSWVLDPRFSWGRGFESYDALFPAEGATMQKQRLYPGAIWVDEDFDGLDRRGDATIEAVESWLEESDGPFFLFVHLFDPHAPYDPPKDHLQALADSRFDTSGRSVNGLSEENLEHIQRQYHAEVTFVDSALARLMHALEATSDSPPLVVITADHGEGLGSHGHLEHSLHLYEEQLHVPLLFHWPGKLAAGARIETPVGNVDVASTLLDLLDLPPMRESDGRSLIASLREGDEPDLRPVYGSRRSFSEGYPPPLGRQITVRMGNWRYIRRQGGQDELYDLSTDPEERVNLVFETDAPTNAMAQIVLEYAARMPKPIATPDLSPEEIENLRAMGYVE